MKDLITLGLVAVGGYLLYEYFYTNTTSVQQPVLTRGAVVPIANSPVRPNSNEVGTTQTSPGMTRQQIPISNTNSPHSRNKLAMRGLGAIGRGEALYTSNQTVRDDLGSGKRAVSAYLNLGESIMSSHRGLA